MKRIIKINENEYISKEIEHTTSLTGTIIELIIYLSLLAALTKFEIGRASCRERV